ncbi:MAG: GAF domain-containing protein [Candidatus Omnitrophica bacterium]|nr:GAF domain-containing protein [Candidatus Omnitrophota bacterium]
MKLYDHYIGSLLLTAAITSILAILVYFQKGQKTVVKITFISYCVSLVVWSSGQAWALQETNPLLSLFIVRYYCHSGVVFIPILFIHFLFSLMEEDVKRFKTIVCLYLVGIVFFIFNIFTDYLVKGVELYPPVFQYVYLPGKLHPVFVLFFIFIVVYGNIFLFKNFKNARGVKRDQLKYLMLAIFLSYLGGTPNFLLGYRIQVAILMPFGTYLLPVFVGIITYTIVKYRLLDIRVAITNVGIFFLLYTLVLGVPFYIFATGLRFIALCVMSVLATAGPFIYFYIQKRAEDSLLKEQRAYQATLRQASGGMGRIKDLQKLLHMIVYVVTRTVRLEHAVIYIYDDVKKIYKLGAFKHRKSSVIFRQDIAESHLIIDYLSKNHVSIIAEEIKQKVKDYQDGQLLAIEAFTREIDASLIVPIYIDNRLVSFVGLGKKESGKLYTDDDLSVFSILSNQAALAIENANFYEDMKLTQEQLFQAEKMATIGIMADGLSHQINNRFHAMGFIAGDALDTIHMNKNLEMSDKLKEIMAALDKALLRIQENVTQGGEVVQGLLKYTRKGEEGFSPVDVDAVVSSAYEMAQFKIKSYQMDLIRDYDKNLLPKVKGNSSQLQEVFFNLIDNAYDAMMQRKNDFKEHEYHPKLIIHASVHGKIMEMIFEDNGTGVKEEDVQKLFTPFFTTKLSSKKGTGLGLYVIRKIIEDNHKGKVEFSSKYMEGTQMKIRLPIAM